MSEWIKIEKQLGNALEDLFEEILILHNDQRYSKLDNAWEDFKRECRERYEMGRAEHAGKDSAWENWSNDEFAKNIREELIDYIIYAAARNTRPLTNHARR